MAENQWVCLGLLYIGPITPIVTIGSGPTGVKGQIAVKLLQEVSLYDQVLGFPCFQTSNMGIPLNIHTDILKIAA